MEGKAIEGRAMDEIEGRVPPSPPTARALAQSPDAAPTQGGPAGAGGRKADDRGDRRLILAMAVVAGTLSAGLALLRGIS